MPKYNSQNVLKIIAILWKLGQVSLRLVFIELPQIGEIEKSNNFPPFPMHRKHFKLKNDIHLKIEARLPVKKNKKKGTRTTIIRSGK